MEKVLMNFRVQQKIFFQGNVQIEIELPRDIDKLSTPTLLHDEVKKIWIEGHPLYKVEDLDIFFIESIHYKK